ncbi:MAG: sodium:solute symporter family protein [Lachnospiraceae bacterium]|nr:sodium:solute symporter family protein [Lachnospiraceae bacterium]
MGIIDYGIIVLYLIGVVAVGLMCKSKTATSSDFMIAGRKMGLSIFIGTYMATAIGGGVLNGWVGTVYDSGMALLPSIMAMYVATILIGCFLAEKLRNFGGFTAPDVLGKVYGKPSQAYGGLLSFLYLMGTGPAMQTVTFGTVIQVVTGIPFIYGAVISMVVILLFTYFSGFWGVAVTDYIQFIIMGFGVAMTAFVVFTRVGGWEGITASVPQDHLQMSTDITTMIRLVFTTCLTTFIDGNRYQRFYACKDAKTAKKGTLLTIIPMHTFFMMILLMGTCSYVLLPGIKPDSVFSSLLLTCLPVGLKGIVFASLLAAILSTSDSYLLVASTNFSNDIYKNIIKPDAADQEILRVTKLTTLVLGVGGLIMAVWMQSIMSIWSLASAAYVGGCFVPMLYALFSGRKKKSALAANTAMVAGSLTAIYCEATKTIIFGLPGAAVGMLLNLVLFFGLTAADKHAQVRSLLD